MKIYTHLLTGAHLLIFRRELFVALRLEPCCFMRCNNFFALGIKSPRHRVEREIPKNSPLIAE